MRITTNAMMRSFNTQLNKQMQQVDATRMQALTGQRFQRGSEDVSGAAKTRKLYRELQQNEIYLSNIKSAQGTFEQAESTLLSVSSLVESAYGHVLDAMNEAKGPDERKIIAEQLRNLQEQMVMDLNTKFGDKYLFGGTSTTTPPFSLGDDGTVYFRGLDVSDPDNFADLQRMANEHIYIDVGIGLQFDAAATEPNTVVQGTAFDTALSGLNYLGFGLDENGRPNNIIALVGKIADTLESDGYIHELAEPLSDKLGELHKNMLVNITGLDSKAAFLESSQKRLDNAQMNINEKLADVAYIDTELAYMQYEAEMYTYVAALKLGASILSASFIDFIT